MFMPDGTRSIAEKISLPRGARIPTLPPITVTTIFIPDQDGGVFRKTAGGWQRYQGGGWREISSEEQASLERQYTARQAGLPELR